MKKTLLRDWPKPHGNLNNSVLLNLTVHCRADVLTMVNHYFAGHSKHYHCTMTVLLLILVIWSRK